MLYLQRTKGLQNIFSVDVFSKIIASSINSQDNSRDTRQYTPNSNTDYIPAIYYIRLIEQSTQKEYFKSLYQDIAKSNYPRSLEFMLYLDSFDGVSHIDVDGLGLYNYEIYSGLTGATTKDDSIISQLVSNGMALIHDENWENTYYQNGESGVTELIIPTTISYNG